MRAILTLVLLLCPAAVRADSFGGWLFDPPADYERQLSDIGVGYAGPNGGFLFLPQTPATDARSAALAMIEQAVPAGTDMRELAQDAAPGSSFWLGAADNLQYVLRSVAVGGQSGTVVFITPATDFNTVGPEIAAMLAAEFAPVALPAPADAAAFPAMDWPAPPTSHDATTRARLSVAQARALGVDPDANLLPGTFDCYITSDPRAVDPRPDLRLASKLGQEYTLSDGINTQSGSWTPKPHDTFGTVVQFAGPIDDYVVINTNDGLGQRFNLDHPTRDADLTCTQDGPATETVLQQLAAVAPTKGAMACTMANGQTARLLYGNGVYTLDGARGSYVAALDGSAGTWRGQMQFSTGPFDLLKGDMTAADGQQVLTVSQTLTEGSMFYTSSKTTIMAVCRMAAPARPLPVYGPDAAAATQRPQGGLPEGVYQSIDWQMVWNGTSANFQLVEVITLIAPGGRMLENPDFAAFGDTPDCSRTTPSGEELCGEYRMVGPMIAFRDARDFGPDAWSDNERLTLTDTGFDVGETSYRLMAQAQPGDLTGAWSSTDYTGSGPGIGGGVGRYTNSDTQWTFGADGRFAWQDARTTTTLITPDPVLGGASGGGSSSSADSGTGQWQLHGMWLDLQFDDGRKKRLPLFHFPPTGDGPATLSVDGVDLAPAGSGE